MSLASSSFPFLPIYQLSKQNCSIAIFLFNFFILKCQQFAFFLLISSKKERKAISPLSTTVVHLCLSSFSNTEISVYLLNGDTWWPLQNRNETQEFRDCAKSSHSSTVSDSLVLLVSGQSHRLRTPAPNKTIPYVIRGKIGLTKSRLPTIGDSRDPTRAAADAVPKAVDLKYVGKSSLVKV